MMASIQYTSAAESSPWLSGHEHFEVWPHDAIEAKRLRDFVEFVQVEASAPPRFDEGLPRNVEADLVAPLNCAARIYRARLVSS